MPETTATGFWRGWRAMLPLWLGVVPFGLAYAVTARDAGLSVVETQALSALVFAGSAQFSAVGLFGRGAGGVEIVLTTLLLNVRHVLYGLALGPRLQLRGPRRLAAAYLLTDEAFGVVAARRERSFAFVLGVELSLFVSWNLATLAGALAGAWVDPGAIGADVVFPLAFLALLVPLLRTRLELGVALTAGALAWAVSRVEGGGVPILVAGIACSLLGAWLSRDDELPADDPADAVREVA